MRDKIKIIWNNHESKIVTFVGLVLVAVVSFEAGILKGQMGEKNPIIIEKPAQSAVLGQESASDSQKEAPKAQNLTQEASKTSQKDNMLPQNCAFVGSKNSNKYHLPTCQFAKRIKPENIVCFSSVEDAQKKRYLPDKGCIK